MGEEVNASAGLIYARSRMTTPRPPLSRSAGIGLTVGLILGSIFLAIRAVLLSRPDCEGLLAQECALEQEIAANLSRLHALFSAGLGLVAAGLYLSLRRKP